MAADVAAVAAVAAEAAAAAETAAAAGGFGLAGGPAEVGLTPPAAAAGVSSVFTGVPVTEPLLVGDTIYMVA